MNSIKKMLNNVKRKKEEAGKLYDEFELFCKEEGILEYEDEVEFISIWVQFLIFIIAEQRVKIEELEDSMYLLECDIFELKKKRE